MGKERSKPRPIARVTAIKGGVDKIIEIKAEFVTPEGQPIVSHVNAIRARMKANESKTDDQKEKGVIKT